MESLRGGGGRRRNLCSPQDIGLVLAAQASSRHSSKLAGRRIFKGALGVCLGVFVLCPDNDSQPDSISRMAYPVSRHVV